MLKYLEMKEIGARPPAPQDLAKAWNKFIGDKASKNRIVNNLQAGHVLKVFEHLRDKRDDNGCYLLADTQLRTCVNVMKGLPKSNGENHVAVAQAIKDELARRGSADEGDLFSLANILAAAGQTVAARGLIPGAEDTQDEPATRRRVTRIRNLWVRVLKGCAQQQDEAELLETFRMMEEGGYGLSPAAQNIMVEFYVDRNDIVNAKKWVGKTLTTSTLLSGTLALILKISIAKNDLDWCRDIFRDVIEKEALGKEYWDVVFLWAAGAVGKGVEDVERMMEVMIRRNPNDEKMRPDITTINGLVDLAISLGDPYLAERYINLGVKYGIKPNARTFLLQMTYRVDAGDMAGAHAAYNALQAEENFYHEDLPAINHYLRALCARANNYGRITTILADLEARKAKLEPDTTSDIAIMYMKREDEQDMYDLLQTNVYHYNLEERGRIRDQFIKFCLDRSNSNAQAWEAYQVVQTIFDETGTELRTQLMKEFFDRGRSDMACYVFGHMRQHTHKTRKPKLETYIACLEGIASCADAESLDMVHNMFKMDSTMEPNTKLYNALMLAYTSIDNGDRALDFWDDITNSIEGPSYQSLEGVFRACQVAPFGEKTARETWSKMRRMEIEVIRNVWQAYIGALAGNGKIDEAKDMIQSGDKEFGLKPDFMT